MVGRIPVQLFFIYDNSPICKDIRVFHISLYSVEFARD